MTPDLMEAGAQARGLRAKQADGDRSGGAGR